MSPALASRTAVIAVSTPSPLRELPAQFGPQHLSGTVLRQVGNEVNGFGALVAGQPCPRSVDYFLLRRRGAGFEHDCGNDFLDPYPIRNPENRGIPHGRIAIEHALDFGRINVLTAGDDHVILAVDDVQ